MNVLIAGDYCPMNRVSALLKEGKTNEVLGEVKSLTDASDYSIVNLECPITSDKDNPIPKCGPNLHCTEKDVEALAKIGFDCVTLANNHFKDYGETAVNNTLGVLSRLGLDVVGGVKTCLLLKRLYIKF